ncbi:MAG: DNA-directed RNA polymerase subunit beta', partial [Candidatus Marinimicrobia bacterium]|nr:DNA-directed RNA polymerase subunit beta' [Candidatus Neomarinimicrobiota bacterium]
AVHVPLSVEAQMEAWLLMLSSHNILHPATGSPIAIPSQDMILGCYYLTRPRNGELGEGSIISSYEEAKLAIDNNEMGLHAKVSFRKDKEWIKDTTIGRIIFNSILPDGMDFHNITVGKKELVNIVKKSYAEKGNYETVQFLDKLKDLGFNSAFQSGISIAISDIHIPQLKDSIIDRAESEISDIKNKFDRQILTEGERYNKVIDVWTHATNEVAQEMFSELEDDNQGFNALYMMADSGARGSQDQIKQLAGMRGLMAKPKKSLVGSAGEIIENPIKSNFKEGLSAFEYFISTHGARKGLADTALKTADAGYLTRRLVDVAQDVTISIEDCGTIQGVIMQDIKEGEKIIEPLYDRIVGRYVVDDVIDPIDGKIYIKSNELVSQKIAEEIAKSSVQQVKVRSVLTCEADIGICVKCYGINLATTTLAKNGDAVGIMAAQSIGEPGTQLTLRTFHIGGTASRIVESSHMEAKKDGKIKFSEKLQLLEVKDKKEKNSIAVSRNGKIELVDSNGIHITGWTIPYGAKVLVKNNEKVSQGDVLFSWDPYTDVILARSTGKVIFKDMIKGETFVEEAVEGGKKMILVTESKDRNLSPHLEIETKKGDETEMVTSILPVKATVIVKEGEKVKAGQILVKIPKDAGKTRDITGGLPRIAELFEARNPSNPAVISEIDGNIKYGKTKRGVKEIHVMGKSEEKVYKIPYGKHVLVHDRDHVFAGDRLCEGSVSPQDILKIRGSYRAQEYLVESIQEVYRLQQVAINDKHIEVIVRQMMHKVSIEDAGDSKFLPGDRVNRFILKNENNSLLTKLVVKDAGDSDYEIDDVVDKKNIQETNKELKEKKAKSIKTRKAEPATFKPLLLGITRASLNTESFISAASFQETTRVLTDAAIEGKTDNLRGLKENVIIGRLIPAGTGSPHAKDLLVSNPNIIEEKTESKDLEKINTEE